MRDTRVSYRSAVILCADVVGYSRLMGMDEEGTLAALKAVRGGLIDPALAGHGGRIVRTMGDGLLVEFSSVLEALRCAIAIQGAMPQFAADAPPDRQIRFRMAIHLGEVIVDGDGIHGDGVAIASRLESLAEPGAINISRAVRDQVRDQLPIVFTDIGEHAVANIARPVRVFRIAANPAAASGGRGAAGRRVPAPPVPPALAVLPFQNLGGDGETQFFLDSVAEDLITELARARWFSVVARNTSFTYRGKAADPKQVARELGVRYVVEGSLRKSGPRVRINCHLAEAASGTHLWADRFDGTLEDSFDLQDRITESVVGAVDPVLREAEIERARRKPAASQDAYDLFLRAVPPAFSETAEDNEAALRLLAAATECDPAYPAANALAAWCRQQRHLMDWPAARPDDREEAKRLARTAIAGGGDDPQALALAGAVRAALTRDHHSALAAVDRATLISPHSAFVLGFDALARVLCGAYDTAVAHAERVLRISPLDRLAHHAALALAWAFLLTDRAEEAALHAHRAIGGNARFALPYCALALACDRLDRPREAQEALRDLARAAPGFRIDSLRRIRFADAARLRPGLDRLRAAGAPG